ncbi:hypothetical protein U0070_003791, partial [Myodes glareolus]
GPALSARSPARPLIPAPSSTPRSCGGARALLIPCLPALRSGSVERSLCGGWRGRLRWGPPLLALRSGRSGGAMPAPRFPASGSPGDRSPTAGLRLVRLGARWPERGEALVVSGEARAATSVVMEIVVHQDSCMVFTQPATTP